MHKPFMRVLTAAATALAVLVALPFTTHAHSLQFKSLTLAEAEAAFIGAVLDAAEHAAFENATDGIATMPGVAIAQERIAVGEQLAWKARHEVTFGSLDRGAAPGVGVPREAERPPTPI
ncbi:MAG: hypothetical protein OXC08_18865 [Thiotrichales bacterium]|nr:hypothetical protein [Thiotrichales bacterium]